MRAFETSTEALGSRLKAWKEQLPELGVLALVAESGHDESVKALQHLSRELDISLAGAVFPELVVDGGFKREGVLLLAISQRADFCILPCSDAEGDAERLYERLSPSFGYDGEDAMMLLFDGQVPHIASLMEAIYRKFADRIHYFGVNAGSETFQPMPCLFDREQKVGGSVLAMALKQHSGALLQHGYCVAGSNHSATSTEGNRISTINWRPAFEVYQELALEQYSVDITPENFYEHSVHFPFGILRANGEVLVRIPVALTDDGSLFCVGEVPPNAVLTLLQARPDELSQAVRQLGERVRDSGWASPLTFYCAGRRMHLGAEAAEGELALLSESVGRVDGALSLGEVGNIREEDYPAFHNGTLVCSPW